MKGEIKKCVFCGKEFTTESNKRKYCTPICGVRARKAFPIQNCSICGKEFRPIAKRQHTCGSEECKRANSKAKKRYEYYRSEGIAPVTRTKKKRPTAKEWETLTPSQRWELMTWDELTAELARLHLSYGQAQVLKERRELPFDFGEKRGGK